MSTVVKENVDALNAKIIVTLKPEDINPKLNTELKKLKNTASLKGFRKGKTPLGFIKKMYGQGVMSDVVNKMIQEELSKFLQEEKIQFLGQPIPALDQEQVDLNVNEVSDMVFKFDLGLTPEFEVKGLDNNAFNRHDVTVSDKMVEDDLSDALKKLGEQKTIEDAITEEDVIKLDAVELSGPLPKEGGLTPSLTLSVKDLTAATKALIIGKKTGDTFRYDVTQLEEGKDKVSLKENSNLLQCFYYTRQHQ